jgi:DegV family protein with EDD domain
MPTIAIVTDTSSDLLPEQAAEAGIRLVPLTVSFGDETFEAVTELRNEDFYPRLTASGAALPKTAAPNPQQFESAYREALESGADGVVCVTLSQKLSATYSSAVQGAAAFEPGSVEVVDSRTTTHALAMIATEAAAFAQGGASLADVAARAQDLADRSHLYFAVDTLEYLQKGGRIGRASAMVGTLLSIKPILFVEDGAVGTADKLRTAAKARARLLELVSQRPVERATVLHTLAPGVEAFRDEFAALVGLAPASVPIGLVGPVAGTHVGPGMYGVSLITPA